MTFATISLCTSNSVVDLRPRILYNILQHGVIVQTQLSSQDRTRRVDDPLQYRHS